MKWILLCSVVVALYSWREIRKGTNNVCKTFEDYYSDRDNNQNCYYNPDGELQVPDIILRHGYPLETYQVVTKDGYILTLFRIPHGKTPAQKFRKPVLITHGMALNAGAFVNTGKKSLGFVLADAGYDVWLGNFRGTKYSRKHTHLDDADGEFWNFSFHELGIYDIPAEIDFINDFTKQKIIYIGYSMGTTAAYVYSISYPVPAYKKIKIIISLAPSVIFQKTGLCFKLLSTIWPVLETPLQAVTKGELFPAQPFPILLHNLFCLPLPFQIKVCQIFEMLFLGFDYEQRDPETLPVTFEYNPDATSMKTLTHYFQLMRTGNFQYFDYGTKENRKMYGTPYPQQYNISNLKVPTYLIVAKNDLGVSTESVEKLYAILPVEAKYYGIHTIEYEKFNHVDFLNAKDIVPFLYDHLVTFINAL